MSLLFLTFEYLLWYRSFWPGVNQC